VEKSNCIELKFGHSAAELVKDFEQKRKQKGRFGGGGRQNLWVDTSPETEKRAEKTAEQTMQQWKT